MSHTPRVAALGCTISIRASYRPRRARSDGGAGYGPAMSVWEFVAAVAWPVALLVIAVLYRPLIATLLKGSLRSVRAGPFELAWEQTRSATGAAAETQQRRSEVGVSVSSLTRQAITE